MKEHRPRGTSVAGISTQHAVPFLGGAQPDMIDYLVDWLVGWLVGCSINVGESVFKEMIEKL